MDQHPDKKAKVGLDWTHPQENKRNQCHQASIEVEKKPWPSQEQPEENGKQRGEKSRLHYLVAA